MKTFEELMKEEKPKLLGCVHCGLCLSSCPTFKISGDENNSPRGRLAMWRALSENKIKHDAVVSHYTDECVGCLACETVCPSNVEYGNIIHSIKQDAFKIGRGPHFKDKVIGKMAMLDSFKSWLTMPARAMRKLSFPFSAFVFHGKPSLWQSSREYAEIENKKITSKVNTVGFFTGCLTEGIYRELNFATIRILTVNQIEVQVPNSQKCCGAVTSHLGLPENHNDLEKNQSIFKEFSIVLSNTSGCAYELSKNNPSKVYDAIYFLNSQKLKQGGALPVDHIYVDLPCHSYHGLKNQKPPHLFLNNLGVEWSLAPNAELCCGAGGSYQMTHTENANQIIADKGSFLKSHQNKRIILATGNPVCMMQWNRYIKENKLKHVVVKHFAELLDDSYRLAGYYK